MRKKNQEKKENIKQAVIKLILEAGFHGASIAKIAREAGVSPATVYIYYASKDDMLREIYEEYADQVYFYILGKIDQNMSGRSLIDTLVRSYYRYINEEERVFHFVEQFSSCPSLSANCRETEGCFRIFQFFDDLKEKGILKDIDNVIVHSILFNTVKCIRLRYEGEQDKTQAALEQLIELLVETLLL
ncbi:MAG: TetR/AcrR family transcriptional regulator [Syntrophomonadaceae bacterium]|jgi:AcrR family transcriptional regulator|nr:TetR/AcrR family transcriptional regulator [Syntrophomonadaceae bacterium]